MDNGNLEERSWNLLQWGFPAPLAPLTEELEADGFYSQIQRQRSDKALEAFDKENPPSRTSELNAFRELEKEGQIKPSVFFSPDKADRSPRYIDPKRRWLGEHNTTTSYSDDLKRYRAAKERPANPSPSGQGLPSANGQGNGGAKRFRRHRS